jgi:phage shock protein C
MEEPKRLYRSRTDRKLGGVCGGIATYLNVDPTIVRLITLLCIITGLSILIYIVMWIVIPEEPYVVKDTTREV